MLHDLQDMKQESDRLEALRRYQILDTPPDGAFDHVTQLVAQFLNVPIAIVSLVDKDRIWFKSHHGLDINQIDRAPGLCSSAILGELPYVIKDAKIDPRSLTNPLVAGEFGLQFYAGIPLRTRDNHNLGVLCALDFKPRSISEAELDAMNKLARVVMDQLELRLEARRVKDQNQKVFMLQEHARLAVEVGNVGIWEFDFEKKELKWDAPMFALYGVNPENFTVTMENWLSLMPTDARETQERWLQTNTFKTGFESTFQVKLPSGKTRFLKNLAEKFYTSAAKPLRAVGTQWATSPPQNFATYTQRNVPVIENSTQEMGLPPHKLKAVKVFIEDHLAEQLSLEVIAKAVHICPSHFTALFKKSTNQSPHQYLMERRIEKAKSLLINAKMPIAEVAFNVGFSDQSHLTRLMRRYTGLTPRMLRKN